MEEVIHYPVFLLQFRVGYQLMFKCCRCCRRQFVEYMQNIRSKLQLSSSKAVVKKIKSDPAIQNLLVVVEDNNMLDLPVNARNNANGKRED